MECSARNLYTVTRIRNRCYSHWKSRGKVTEFDVVWNFGSGHPERCTSQMLLLECGEFVWMSRKVCVWVVTTCMLLTLQKVRRTMKVKRRQMEEATSCRCSRLHLTMSLIHKLSVLCSCSHIRLWLPHLLTVVCRVYLKLRLQLTGICVVDYLSEYLSEYLSTHEFRKFFDTSCIASTAVVVLGHPGFLAKCWHLNKTQSHCWATELQLVT